MWVLWECSCTSLVTFDLTCHTVSVNSSKWAICNQNHLVSREDYQAQHWSRAHWNLPTIGWHLYQNAFSICVQISSRVASRIITILAQEGVSMSTMVPPSFCCVLMPTTVPTIPYPPVLPYLLLWKTCSISLIFYKRLQTCDLCHTSNKPATKPIHLQPAYCNSCTDWLAFIPRY